MQNVFKATAAAAICAVAVSAHAELALDANLELDTTYTNAVDAPATNARASDLGMGGRVEFNVGAKGTKGDAFVAGRASLALKKDGSTAVDDMWVQFGNASVDVKLGRFEGMDLFPAGKDTVLEFAGYTPYRANQLRGRYGSDAFHGALGVNAGEGLRFELGLAYSKNTGDNRGVRPAVVYSSGPLTLRAGFESVKVVGGTASAKTGVGLSLGYALDKATSMNVNFAKKEKDRSFAINAVMGAAGVGLVHGKGATAADKVTSVYAAYTLPLFNVTGASVTPALSYSKGGSGTDSQVAARVRINYAF